MTNILADISVNKAAKIAGIGYVIIFVLGIFANFFIFTDLIVKGDATATANNILANCSRPWWP